MSKKYTIGTPFMALEKTLLNSEEWKSLSSRAIHVYILMRCKFTGNNASNISLTYSEVSGHMSPATFSKTLKELLGKEIIRIIRPGGLENRCTIFSVTNKWFRNAGNIRKS